MSTTKWLIGGILKSRIVKVEVLKETAKQAVIAYKSTYDERRVERRINREGALFNTFDDAKSELVRRCMSDLESARITLATREKQLERARALMEGE